MNHVKEWFAHHDVCPSGCGCNCRLASSMAQREADFLAQNSPPNVKQPLQQLDGF